MRYKHNYFILDKHTIQSKEILSFLIKFPYFLVKGVISFFLARNITSLALNPRHIREQKSFNYIHLSNNPSGKEIVIVNLYPHQHYKIIKDYLLKFIGTWLPFIAPKRIQLNYDRLEDRTYIDKIIKEMDGLLKAQENKKFDWKDIYFKGLACLDERMQVYFMEEISKKYGATSFTQKRNVNLDFFMLETADHAVLDSVAVLGKGEENKPIGERQFIIACMARDQNYINWLKDFKKSANKINCTIIGFNYRGVDYSQGIVWTQDDMVKDALAQAERLLALGVKPENIGFEGMCLGGAVATIAAATMHERGHEVKLYNERSFRSLSHFITGFILPEKGKNLWNPLNLIRYVFAGLAYLITSPFIWLADSNLNAAKAWDKIPLKDKEYSVIRQAIPNQGQRDGIIEDSWASIASLMDRKKSKIIKKIKRGHALSAEEQQLVNDRSEDHYFHVANDVQCKVPHFAARRNLVQDSKESRKPLTMHDHMISSFKKIFNQFSRKSYTHTPSLNELNNSETVKVKRPLCIASSGGAGHISAVMGIIDTLKATSDSIAFPQYQAKLIVQKPTSLKSKFFLLWVHLSSIAGIGYLINKLIHFFGVLELPDEKQFWQEMKRIEKNEKEPNNLSQGRQRPYVDFLLDAHPQGYESAAVVNLLQRADKFDDIKWLVKHKNLNTKFYYKEIYDYFFNLLVQAAEQGQAYTEIISTQPTELGLLCDVVLAYNKYIDEKNKTRIFPLTPISIHQYLTDLPTTGCEHFLDTLADLTPSQKSQMHVYAVNFHMPVVCAFLDQGKDFQGIHNMEPFHNPMIRAAFKDNALVKYLDRSQEFNLEIELSSQNNSQNRTLNSITDKITIPPHAKVAAIMLSSVAAESSSDYVQELLKNNYDKIFLFGGLQDHIYKKIQTIIASYPPQEREKIASRIVCLGTQNDTHVAPIMVRSDCIVMRGGGLSVMEQMAVPHHPEQKVFIHDSINNDSDKEQAGLSWEDGNANELIDFLHSSNIFVKRTSPQRFSSDLSLSAKKAQLTAYNGKPSIDKNSSLDDNPDIVMTSNTPIKDKAKKFFALSAPRPCFKSISLFARAAPRADEAKEAFNCPSCI